MLRSVLVLAISLGACSLHRDIGARSHVEARPRTREPKNERGRERAEPEPSGASGPALSDGVAVRGLANIQRTLGLLANSTPAHHPPVRILFYGQSITQSAWSRNVERALRERFPHADLQIENRALGGYPAQLLVETAETDLYPYYPDLVIFHVYGDHRRYEDIVRRLRERTTAEVLLQSDHIVSPEDLHEELDPTRLSPTSEQWSAFMNQLFLPGLVERYDTALCDVRAAWKEHLRAHGLLPGALLLDAVHPNSQGDALLAALVERCLVRAPQLDPSPAEAWVETLRVGPQLSWSGRELRLAFEGNRVDAILASGSATTITVQIDGKPPSAWPTAYAFARAHAREGGKWPPVHDLSVELGVDGQRAAETFTLAARRADTDAGSASAGGLHSGPALYEFALTGSQTGADGSGRSDRRFVSRSGRVVIDPDDWNVDYAFELAGQPTPPDRFTVDLRVEPHFTDALGAAQAAGGKEQVVTLVAGLSNGHHELVLTRAPTRDETRLLALRVYRPPLTSGTPCAGCSIK